MSIVNIPQHISDTFNAVDSYFCDMLLPADPALDGALEANAAASLDQIDVAPNQGKFLYLLAKMNNAKRILEIGTLGGYSAIWFAKALPSDGQVITLEVVPEHARIAESNIKNAGLSHIVDVRLGHALDTLSKMGKDPATGQFDLVFIDADKENNPGYLEWALKFSHVGTVIVIDNVVRGGKIVDPNNKAPQVEGVRKAFKILKNEKRLESTAIQTVGFKSWDGFAVARVVQ
jgi:predicted O-methyltransferase YrrM